MSERAGARHCASAWLAAVYISVLFSKSNPFEYTHLGYFLLISAKITDGVFSHV